MQYIVLYYDDEVERPNRRWVPELCTRGTVPSPLQIVLLPTATAVTVRSGLGGGTVVLDGPFAETSEQLLGICVVDSVSLAEVLNFVEQCYWTSRGSSFEIRPVELALLPKGVTSKATS